MLRDVFLLSLHLLVCLSGLMLAYGEGTPFPAGLTPIVAVVAYLVTEKQGRFHFNAIATNLLGLVAAAAAVGEFLTPNLEARLLSGAHFLVYLTWIVLFCRKEAREYWWLGAFGLLQVAVGSVLTSTGAYGLMLLAYILTMLWTMAVGNVFLRAGEYQLDGGPPGAGGDTLQHILAGPRGFPAIPGSGVTTIDRHGLCQDTPGRWIGSRFVRSVAGTALLGVLAGVLVFLFVPRFWIGTGNPFVSASPGPSSAVTGFSRNIMLGQAGELLEDGTPVFRMRLVDDDTDREISLERFVEQQGFEGPFFRGSVLDNYSRGKWSLAVSSTAVENDDLEALRGLTNQSGAVRQEYFMEETNGPVVFGLLPVDLGRIQGARGTILRHLQTGALSLEDAKAVPQQYSLWTLPQRRRPRLPPLPTMTSRGRPSRIARQYLQLPAELTRLRELASTLVEGDSEAGVSRDRGIADRTVELLRDSSDYSYSLSTEVVDPELDPVEDFLFNTRQGHCQYFASALTLLLRANGIPARLVVGYKGAEPNSATGFNEVQRRHAHAWVEAWYDNVWTTLDAVPAERDEEVRRYRSKRGFWGNARDSLSSLWSNYFVSMSIEKQQTSLYDPLNRAWTEVRGMAESFMAVIRDFGSVDPETSAGAQKFFVILLVCLIAGGALLRAVWRRLSVDAQDSDRERGGLPGLFGKLLERWFGRNDPARRVVSFYEHFNDLVEKRGLVRQPHQTQREFAREVATTLNGQLRDQALDQFPVEVADLFYRVRFGDAELSATDLAGIERRLEEFAESLRPATTVSSRHHEAAGHPRNRT